MGKTNMKSGGMPRLYNKVPDQFSNKDVFGKSYHGLGGGRALASSKELDYLEDRSPVSDDPKTLNLATKSSSCPSSSNPSDYEFDDEESVDSTHAAPSTDQKSWASAAADAENRSNEILDKLMSRLQEWLEIRLRQRGTQNARQTSNHGSTLEIGALGHPGPSSRGAQIPKRRRSDSDDELGGDDGKEPDHNQKGGKPGDTIEARYVCPFFKHNRERYQTSQWKSCCWPGWVSTHRVK